MVLMNMMKVATPLTTTSVMAKTWPFMRHRSRQSFRLRAFIPLITPSALPIIPSPPCWRENLNRDHFICQAIIVSRGDGKKRRKISLSIRMTFPEIKNYCLTTRYGYYSNVSRGKRQQEGLDDAIPCILEPQGNERLSGKVGPGRFRRYTKQIPWSARKCQGSMRIIDQKVS